MYPRMIAAELCARGHDAISVHDSPGSGTSDEDVLSHAIADGRAVVTENVRDLRPLAEALLVTGQRHAGLVFTTAKRWPRTDPGQLITALDSLAAATPHQPLDTEL
jgi:hypothetical protein